mmetsp:Transcript_88589/g.225492  ORF Transcript_88589/g.225492 Transcript_88589/m.225492 type:complete len:693 (+) Transcript_88589:92-2170(+)|eukprot:CAMPEP_0183511924 /NCGR_PEP_ID=MMETSP0371-20130417/11215_1 /TAXON_ID=268820 /ORGANISM="Peridinium aciculiferum, Strain PAER-2" /LENGTH=692 /DNA_ID=CAMNT_0025708911 /DNA_START=1 /DNA_END=2079 /DNA_ORIENTATION=+
MEFTFRGSMAPRTRDGTAQVTREDKLKHFHIAIDKVRPLLESPKRWKNEANTVFRELRTCSIHLRNDAFDMLDECQTTIDSFLERMRQTPIFSRQCEEVSNVVVEGNIRAKLASSCAAEQRSDLQEVTRQVQSEAGVMQELDVLVKELQQVVDSQDSGPKQANFGDRISSTCEKLQSFWLKQRSALIVELEAAKQAEDDAFLRASISGEQCRRWDDVVVDWLSKFQTASDEAVEQAERAQQILEKAEAKLKAANAQQEEMKKEAEVCEHRAKKKEDEAKASIEELQRNHEKAKQLANDTSAGKKVVDEETLVDLVKGGDHVWGWKEDEQRWSSHNAEVRKHGSQSNPIILYSQENWSRVEAQYLLYSHAREERFRFMTLHVAKVFNPHTGDKYKLDFQENVQSNVQTNFSRRIYRVSLSGLKNFSAEDAQRLIDGVAGQRGQAAEAARIAASSAAKKLSVVEKVLPTIQNGKDLAERLRQGTDQSVWVLAIPKRELLGLPHYKVPMAWHAMGKQTYMEVNLAGCPDCHEEMLRVQQFFSKTSKNTVLSVKRVQNAALWHLYVASVRALPGADVNNAAANEDLLWHGARAAGAMEKILSSGFDSRLFASQPQGVWLSTTSNYSVGYCWPNGGSQKMLLVRAALGNIGQHSIHIGGTSKGYSRIDDQTTGSGDNRYVIPDAPRAYPAYIVEFAS